MFSKEFQRKYALTDQGLKNTKRGAVWTVITNLVVMGGMGILYLLMGSFRYSDGRRTPARGCTANRFDHRIYPFVLFDTSAAVPRYLWPGV